MTPEERLAALAAKAQAVHDQAGSLPPGTGTDLALSLAAAVLKHARPEPEPVSFSFEVEPPAKTSS